MTNLEVAQMLEFFCAREVNVHGTNPGTDYILQANALVRNLRAAAEPPAPQDREPHNIMQRYKAERTTLGEAITEIRRYGEECARRAMGKSSFAVSCSEAAPVALPFAHWSKDPLVPYTGCGCVSCVDARVAAASTLSWTEIRLPYESGVTYYSCQHYPPHAMRRNPCDRGCT